MTNEFIEKQVKLFCSTMNITFEKDIEYVRKTLELVYWTGRVEQQKDTNKNVPVEGIDFIIH